MKLKKLLSVALAVCLTGSLTACGKGSLPDADSTPMIDMTHNYITIANDNVSVLLDRETGYVATVKNVRTGTVNKSEAEGQWPFYLEYQKEGTSVVKKSSIQKETNNKISALRTFTADGREYLEVRYDNLVTDGSGKDAVETGIGATVTYSIGADDEYFKYNVGIDMTNAGGTLNALHLANGGDLRSGDGAREQLTAPVWGTGTKWVNPIANEQLMTKRTHAYPGANGYSLEAGWMDLSGDTQGVGIAYINKQQTSCEFRFESSGAGMSVEVVLFQPKQVLGKSVPLVKGEKWTSDDLVVSSHTGSWHKHADIYRGEYQKAFMQADGSADYLTAETLSARADRYRYFFRETGNYSGTGTNPDGSVASFRDMNRNFDEDMAELGVKPENTFLWLVGLNENTYGRDVPFTLPFNERDLVEAEDAAAGLDAQACFDKYIKEGYIDKGGDYMLYSHPFAVDPLQPDIAAILAQVDPDQHDEEWNGAAHKSICIDNDTAMKLWKETLIPQYKTLHAAGVQFDQCSLVQTVCDREGHNHGTDAVSRLSSHAQAITQLCQTMRSELADDAFILSEASNDITCRYVDIRQNHWIEHPPKWGGDFEYGAMMYTHPQYVYTNCNYRKDSLGNIGNFFLQSAVLGGPVLLTDGGDVALKREYVRFVDSLYDNAVPGFPHGYKDDIGLAASSGALFARVYTDGNDVSVLYCAQAAVKSATITVDLEKLGFTGKGTKTLTVENMAGSTASYQTFTVA